MQKVLNKKLFDKGFYSEGWKDLNIKSFSIEQFRHKSAKLFDKGFSSAGLPFQKISIVNHSVSSNSNIKLRNY